MSADAMSTELVTIDHEGATWALLRRGGGEHKIEDRELAGHLEVKTFHLRQRIEELHKEDSSFDPEFIGNGDKVPSVGKKGMGRPEKGAYFMTLEEALYLTTRQLRQLAGKKANLGALVAAGQIAALPKGKDLIYLHLDHVPAAPQRPRAAPERLREEVRIPEIVEGLGLVPGRPTESRLGLALRDLGWVKRRLGTTEQKDRPYVYERVN
jgi:hypothetical protein